MALFGVKEDLISANRNLGVYVVFDQTESGAEKIESRAECSKLSNQSRPIPKYCFRMTKLSHFSKAARQGSFGRSADTLVEEHGYWSLRISSPWPSSISPIVFRT